MTIILLSVIIIVLGALGFAITYTNDLLFKMLKELKAIDGVLSREERRHMAKR